MTLVVQAMNFLGAYLVLRYGFFNRAVACAQADKEYNNALVSTIVDRKVIIEQKKIEQEEHWKTCQYKLAKHEPRSQTLQINYDASAIPPLEVLPVSDAIVTHAVTKSVAAIKKMGDLS